LKTNQKAFLIQPDAFLVVVFTVVVVGFGVVGTAVVGLQAYGFATLVADGSGWQQFVLQMQSVSGVFACIVSVAFTFWVVVAEAVPQLPICAGVTAIWDSWELHIRANTVVTFNRPNRFTGFIGAPPTDMVAMAAFTKDFAIAAPYVL